MTTLTKTKPNRNFFPGVFSDFFSPERFFGPGYFEGTTEETVPSVNIKELPDAFQIELAAPGYAKNDFNIRLDEDVLSISAEKKEEKNEDEGRYTRREYAYNSFTRAFTLPANSNPDLIDARYTDGILRLMMPKKEAEVKNAKKEIKVA